MSTVKHWGTEVGWPLVNAGSSPTLGLFTPPGSCQIKGPWAGVRAIINVDITGTEIDSEWGSVEWGDLQV